MKGFYQITKALNDELKTAGFNTVTFGDITQVDLKRQTIYPLAHITPDVVTSQDATLNYSFQVLGMDLIDFNKDDVDDENVPFYGIDNKQDVLHDILLRLQQAVEQFKRGDQFDALMQLQEPMAYDPFVERFENVLAGWSFTFSVTAPKYAKIC